MTFLAALRHDRITTPWLLEGPIDGDSFATYVEKVLLPTLRPGDIVITDNLGSHRGKVVRQLIRSAGAKLFLLPKYSPDLNPISWRRRPKAEIPCVISRRFGRCVGQRALAPLLGQRIVAAGIEHEDAHVLRLLQIGDDVVDPGQ